VNPGFRSRWICFEFLIKSFAGYTLAFVWTFNTCMWLIITRCWYPIIQNLLNVSQINKSCTIITYYIISTIRKSSYKFFLQDGHFFPLYLTLTGQLWQHLPIMLISLSLTFSFFLLLFFTGLFLLDFFAISCDKNVIWN